MPQQLQPLGVSSLSAVQQVLVDKEKRVSLGNLLQVSYGETICDDIFDSLMSTLDSIGSIRVHPELTSTSSKLDRLLTNNL